MARVIQTDIKRVLADKILFGRLQGGGPVEIDCGADGLPFEYEPEPQVAAPATTDADESDEI